MTSEQLGFGFDEMAEEQRTAYLPATMEEAVPFYRTLIERHNDAMLVGNETEALRLREDAEDLAIKLNGGTSLGIKGGREAPCYMLERATQAPTGTVPRWGQTGDFTVDVDGMPVRIEMDGMFGLGMMSSPYAGFSAHAVDYRKPFLSETGYRSFLGCHAEMAPGVTPDMFAREMIRAYITRECKGKARKIERSYVEREMERSRALRSRDL